MNIVLDTYLFDALQAQSEGVDFPVEFEAVWGAFGFTRKDNAQKYFKKNAETFVKLNLLQLEWADNQSIDFNKLRLSITGFKFALARAKTDKGAEYLLHLLLIEKQFLTQLEAQFTAPSHTAPTFSYPVSQLREVANYCTLAYTKAAIRRDYVEGLHYVIDIKTASTHLEVAGVLDSEYLFLVSKVKEYFDTQVEAGLSR